MLLVFLLQIILVVGKNGFYKEYQCEENEENLKSAVEKIMEEILLRTKCIVFITDSVYRTLVDITRVQGSTIISKYEIAVRQNEQFSRPRRRIRTILADSKAVGCSAYVILVANGFLTSEFLQYTESMIRAACTPYHFSVHWSLADVYFIHYFTCPGLLRLIDPDQHALNRGNLLRAMSLAKNDINFLCLGSREHLIDTRGLFLLLYDHRLFQPNLRYLWNRIINVVFIRRYNAYTHRSGEKISKERIELDTVYFPAHRKSFTKTKYINTWSQGKLRYNINHFTDKTIDLRKKHLRIAVFEHIPAVTEKSRAYYNKRPSNNTDALGIEFELIQTISEAMNFKPKYYMPRNIASEKWGTEDDNQTYTGLISEAIQGKAAFYLGDLHYTLQHLNYFDLTIPYNTECLTFLTPESLTINSWKLLILPFKLYTWIALLLTLILGGIAFYFLSEFYKKHISLYKSKMHVLTTSMKKEMKGLYLFTGIQNSILCTYSMLFQVSLPSLPNPWAVRVFIGWWWIYSILVAVAYRASMTATLANPVARVTINALTQLAKSSIDVGGWDKESKHFFLTSSDRTSQEIGNKFQLIVNEGEAIEKVANGSFCYYENSYLLQYARVKRQILEKEQREDKTKEDQSVKHNLHIMEECAINMPIALGMEKNSPLKLRVDTLVQRLIEIGLVEKWLSDVMEWSKIMEIRQETESEKALVNLYKLQGAFIAIIVGYLLALIVLIGEILYWKYIIVKDPKFDKYHLDVFYNVSGRRKIQTTNLKL